LNSFIGKFLGVHKWDLTLKIFVTILQASLIKEEFQTVLYKGRVLMKN